VDNNVNDWTITILVLGIFRVFVNLIKK